MGGRFLFVLTYRMSVIRMLLTGKNRVKGTPTFSGYDQQLGQEYIIS